MILLIKSKYSKYDFYQRFILLWFPSRLFLRTRGTDMEEREARTLLGRRIRALRLRQELTQEALGERAGLNYKYLGAIERGERNLSLKQLLKIAQALGLIPTSCSSWSKRSQA